MFFTTDDRLRFNRQKTIQMRSDRLLVCQSIFFLLSLCPHLNLAAVSDQIRAQQHASRGFDLAQKGDLNGAESELRQALQLAPNDPQILSGLGGILGMQQKLKEAEVYFEKALKLDPQNLMLRRNLAANQWQLGQLQEAEGNLESILKAKPGDEPTILLLGMVMENLKDYTRAADLLGSVPALVRQRPESLAALTRTYYKTGQKEKARGTLRILQDHPAAGVFIGAQMAAEAEDFEIAERLFASIRPTYPDTSKLGYNLALVQYRAHKFRESQVTLLGLIGEGYASSEIYNLLGWCYQKQDKPKEAARALEQAIDQDPSKESNYLDLGMILASNKLFPAALVVAKENVERHTKSYYAQVMKGFIELRMEQYTDAVASYQRATELDPANPEAWRGLAVAQFAAGMTGEAVATFEKGLKQFPQDPLQYQEYAITLFKLAETGDKNVEARAVDLMRTAMAMDGSLSQPRYYLGNLALQRGKASEALQYLEAAARLDQKNSKIHYALSRAYRRLGRGEEAAKEQRLYQESKASEEKSAPGFSAVVMGK